MRFSKESAWTELDDGEYRKLPSRFKRRHFLVWIVNRIIYLQCVWFSKARKCSSTDTLSRLFSTVSWSFRWDSSMHRNASLSVPRSPFYLSFQISLDLLIVYHSPCAYGDGRISTVGFNLIDWWALKLQVTGRSVWWPVFCYVLMVKLWKPRQLTAR